METVENLVVCEKTDFHDVVRKSLVKGLVNRYERYLDLVRVVYSTSISFIITCRIPTAVKDVT